MPQCNRGTRPARWALLGLLAASMAVPASWANEPTPDAVLRGKGLTRNGPMYLLKEEDDLRDRVAEIGRLYSGWDQEKGRLVEELAILDRAQLRYQELLQRQKALEEDWQAASKESDPPPRSGFNPPPPDFNPPPPGFNPPPPGFNPSRPGFDHPPPGDMKKFDASGREGFHRQERLGQIRRQYQNLQAERVPLEAQIVRGRFSTDDLAGRLETKRREIEGLRVEALKLDEEIRARYATLAAGSDVKRALLTINESGGQQVRLGPREDYAMTLKAMASELLEGKAPLQKRRGQFELKEMSWMALIIVSATARPFS